MQYATTLQGHGIGELAILDVHRVEPAQFPVRTVYIELTLLQVSKPPLYADFAGVLAATEQGEQRSYIE